MADLLKRKKFVPATIADAPAGQLDDVLPVSQADFDRFASNPRKARQLRDLLMRRNRFAFHIRQLEKRHGWIPGLSELIRR